MIIALAAFGETRLVGWIRMISRAMDDEAGEKHG